MAQQVTTHLVTKVERTFTKGVYEVDRFTWNNLTGIEDPSAKKLPRSVFRREQLNLFPDLSGSHEQSILIYVRTRTNGVKRSHLQ